MDDRYLSTTPLNLELKRNIALRLCAFPWPSAVTSHWLESMDLSSLIILENFHQGQNGALLTKTLMRRSINKFLICLSERKCTSYFFRGLCYYNPILVAGHWISFLECCGEENIFRKVFVLPDFTCEISFLVGTKSIKRLRTNISLPSQLLLGMLIHPGTDLVSGKHSDEEWKSFPAPGRWRCSAWPPCLILGWGLPTQFMARGLQIGRISTQTSCRTLGRILNLWCWFSHRESEDNGSLEPRRLLRVLGEIVLCEELSITCSTQYETWPCYLPSPYSSLFQLHEESQQWLDSSQTVLEEAEVLHHRLN